MIEEGTWWFVGNIILIYQTFCQQSLQDDGQDCFTFGIDTIYSTVTPPKSEREKGAGAVDGTKTNADIT